jgi:outer membrane protein assembly factor BamB
MPPISDPIYIALKGTVLSLDRNTGRELWRTPLKGWDFVNLTLDDTDLFATTKGEIFCLDPSTGKIRWNNPLKGLGLGLATIATANNTSALSQQLRRQQQQAAAAG